MMWTGSGSQFSEFTEYLSLPNLPGIAFKFHTCSGEKDKWTIYFNTASKVLFCKAICFSGNSLVNRDRETNLRAPLAKLCPGHTQAQKHRLCSPSPTAQTIPFAASIPCSSMIHTENTEADGLGKPSHRAFSDMNGNLCLLKKENWTEGFRDSFIHWSDESDLPRFNFKSFNATLSELGEEKNLEHHLNKDQDHWKKNFIYCFLPTPLKPHFKHTDCKSVLH